MNVGKERHESSENVPATTSGIFLASIAVAACSRLKVPESMLLFKDDTQTRPHASETGKAPCDKEAVKDTLKRSLTKIRSQN